MLLDGLPAAAPDPDRRARALSLSPRFLALAFLATLLIAGANLFAPSGAPADTSGAALTLAQASLPGLTLPPGRIALNLALVVLFIFLNALFGIAEYALLTVRKTRIRQLVEEGNRSARLVEKLLAQPTRLMATIQTGATLLATLSAGLAAISTVGPLAEWIRLRFPAVAPFADIIALLVITLPVAALTLVIGEVAPKSLAVRFSERIALLVARPVSWLQMLLSPVVALLTLTSNVVVRPFGGTASFTTPAVNEEELKMMVEASEEQGVLEADATEMIHSILDFGDLVARKVMTPRIDMTALDANAALTELVLLVNESGHSRIPVYEGDLDNIVGIVHAKDLLRLPAPFDAASIRDAMRPPYFIPETKKIDELLAEFRRSRQQIALVRDEYGVTSGIVTIEDLLEEIVGEIQDEYDEEEPMVQVIDSGVTILDGKMSLNDVNDRMGLSLPEDEADTIGGFVFGLLGHQAQAGESVVRENVEFIVEATDGRRITKVRLVQRPSQSDAPPSPSRLEEPPQPVEPTGNGNGRHAIEISGVETAPGFPLRR